MGEEALRRPGVFLSLPALEGAMAVLTELATLAPPNNANAVVEKEPGPSSCAHCEPEDWAA